jgi:tetratricopeptide (TPR) repeat protein
MLSGRAPFHDGVQAILVRIRLTATTSINAPHFQVKTATEAVEKGLVLFEKGEINAALSAFQLAITLSPTEDEACAALYNSACCYTKLKQWQPAVDSVTSAVNDYNLKLDVALKVYRSFATFLLHHEHFAKSHNLPATLK